MVVDLGSPVRCSDGLFGELVDVILDPATKRLTHLVVRPHELDCTSRLVPIELATEISDHPKEVILRCTLAEAQELEAARTYAPLGSLESRERDPNWDVGAEETILPSYDTAGLAPFAGLDASSGVAYDRVPKGEAEIRRASTVVTADGDYVGGIDGLVVAQDKRITHLVIETGRLWRRRRVTIPIECVAGVETDTVTLGITHEQVSELPSVRVHHWF
jgi:sporulation protein YlmC with PRC-barrel domain